MNKFLTAKLLFVWNASAHPLYDKKDQSICSTNRRSATKQRFPTRILQLQGVCLGSGTNYEHLQGCYYLFHPLSFPVNTAFKLVKNDRSYQFDTNQFFVLMIKHKHGFNLLNTGYVIQVFLKVINEYLRPSLSKAKE